MNEFQQERIDFDKAHSISEKQVKPYFNRALNKNVERIVTWVNTYGLDNVPVNMLLNRGVWRDAYLQVYQLIGMKFARREFYRQRTLDGLEVKDSAIDFLVDVWSGKLREFALNYINGIETDLNQTTIDLITQALGKDYSLGVDQDGKVRLFLTELKNILKTRGLTFSRTETTTMANLGKDIGARSWIDEQGGQGYKVWLGRIIGERDDHLHLNDTVVPIDEKYDMSGDLCDRPGDVSLPARKRINCRCTQSFMTENRYNQYVNRGRIVDNKLTGAS